MKIFLTLIVLFGWISTSVAQDINKARLDSFFTLIDTHQKGMGSISIFKNEEEVYQHTIGFANIADRILATRETKYRIGSISKTYTAAIIMQLIEENKLTLDSKLSEYFPELTNSELISIEHLLRHRSGLFNLTSAEDFSTWMSQEKTREELLQIMNDYGSVFMPGERYEYSNTNYILLTLIAENLTGKRYPTLLLDQLTKPLNLKNTHYGKEIDIQNGEATSYIKSSGKWEPASVTDPSIPLGAGGNVATPDDVNRFLIALFQGEIVNKASLEKMMTLVDSYGLGLKHFSFRGRIAFGHTGGIDGFQSVGAYFPEERIAITYVSNGVDMERDKIIVGVLSILFGEPYDFPEF